MQTSAEFISNIAIACAMFMDEQSMTAQQGIEFAERLNGEVEQAADERRFQDNVVQDAECDQED